MKVLVVGGAGFVGSHVVTLLHERGHYVTVADNLSRGAESNLPDTCTFLCCDARDIKADLAERYDIIYDFAARVYGVRDLYARPADLLAENVEVTISLLRAAVCGKIKRYVYISSSCVYDHLNARVPHREDDIGLCDTSYGLSKLFGEELCRYYARQHGLSVPIARLFNVYGPRDSFQSPHVIPDFMRKAWAVVRRGAREFPIIGDGNQTRDFTWVEDAAAGILAVGEHGTSGEAYNIGTGREISIKSLAWKICDLFSASVAEPSPAAGAAAVFRYDPAPPEDIRRRAASTGKARDVLGWEAKTTLAEGLFRVRDWMLPRLEDGRIPLVFSNAEAHADA